MSVEEMAQVQENAESLRNSAGLTVAVEFVTGGGLGYLALKSGFPASAMEGVAATGLAVLGAIETRIAIRAHRAAGHAESMGDELAAYQEMTSSE